MSAHNATYMSDNPWKVEIVGADEIETLVHLWTTVFGIPASAFETTYNSYLPNERISLVVKDGGVPVSCVQIFRAELGWFTGTARVGAIANVSTLPSHRGKGLSSLLLTESLAQMRDRNCHWSYLFTGVPQHYARFGWSDVFQDEAIFEIPEQEGSLQTIESGDWMHKIYASASRHPLWQQRTDLAWQTRLGPIRPWPNRVLIGEPRSDYAALSLEEDATIVLEWAVLPGNKAAATARLAAAARAAGKPKLKILKGILEAGSGLLETELSEPNWSRIGRGMVLPLKDGLTHGEIQRLFDAPRAHFSPLDAF